MTRKTRVTGPTTVGLQRPDDAAAAVQRAALPSLETTPRVAVLARLYGTSQPALWHDLRPSEALALRELVEAAVERCRDRC